jgi:hypothetical protein
MRTFAAAFLALLGAAFLVGGALAWDARATLLDTDRWVDVTSPVVEQPAVREELSGMLVKAVAARIACRGSLEALVVGSVLGDRAQDALEVRVEQALASKTVREAWVDANREGHERFVRAVRLDQEPSSDRLLDFASLLDVVADAADPGSSSTGAPSDAARSEACEQSDDASVQLVDPTLLRDAADAARAFHDQRRTPELLLIVGGVLIAFSLMFLRPLTTLAFVGGGCAALGLGFRASREDVLDAIVGDMERGDGAVSTRAIADAVLHPAFNHQLAIGVTGVVVVVIAVMLAVSRTRRRGSDF